MHTTAAIAPSASTSHERSFFIEPDYTARLGSTDPEVELGHSRRTGDGISSTMDRPENPFAFRSDAKVRKLSEEFICVKADPRASDGIYGDAAEYKATRYVPEVVLIDPDGEVVDYIDSRSVEGVTETLISVLAELKR